MTALYLYDDRCARDFEPFALTRPAGELRAGAWLVRRRWEHALGQRCAGHVVAGHLADFSELDSPGAVREGVIPAGSVIANARALPRLHPLPVADGWRCNGEVAAIRLRASLDVSVLADGETPLASLIGSEGEMADIGGWWLTAVWDVVGHLAEMLRDDLDALAPSLALDVTHGATVLGGHAVLVEEGAHIEPHVVFDASTGPILVSRGASVAAFTRLVGPSYVAPGAQVLGGKVVACSIGEQCRVHGEVSTTVFIGHANKGHDGFVGHSVLGRWSNLGASTVTSNLKNTYGAVPLWTPGGLRVTGLQFLGSMIGDHAKTAIGTRLTTGTVIGAGANVVVNGLTPKVVEPFAWGDGSARYALDKFLDVAERVMARRGIRLDEAGRQHLARVHAARWVVAP